MKHISIFVVLLVFLSGCNLKEEGITVSTGPEIDILNVVDVGLNVDNNGEIVLEGGVSIPTPIHTEIFDVNWNIGFEKVLKEAADKTYFLYVVWENENGTVNEIYDIRQPFQITFERKDWVKKIARAGDNSIVVAIEKQELLAEVSWQPSNEQTWSNIISVRMPTLNEIRKDLISIWDANLLDVNDINSPGSRTYNGTVEPNREYLWPYYWCTKASDILEDNVKHIKITFYVNEEVVPKDNVFYYHYDTNTNWNCGYWATVVSDWPRGDRLEMILEYIFDTEVYDGVKNYPAGKYRHILYIDVPN